jgi:carboxypeptidase Q
MRAVLFTLLLSLGASATAEVDRAMLNRIVDEGMNRSELPQTASFLTDRIGGRLTNSPQMRLAEKWTQEQFRSWGLQNVRAEGFEFGRGWSMERCEVRMLTPRVLQLHAIPVAWTPATQGVLNAAIVVAPIKRERDFAKWKGQLRGKIVLVDEPGPGSEPDRAAFRRYSDQELNDLDVFRQPVQSETRDTRALKRAAFAKQRDEFLASEGALAWIQQSYRDGGLLHGQGYSYRVGETPALPAVEMMAEDYRRLARLAKAGVVPTLELNNDVRFHDEDRNAYNILAELPGRDPKAGYVMAGAHLDSWAASDGAADNAAGSATIMEAARILAKLGVKPRRTVRFVLWAGEEEGLLGSLAYVEKYLAQRPPVSPELAKLSPFATWDMRWPVKVLPGSDDLAAYFNVDNGSGKVRGIYTEGNFAVVPIFQDWLQPFSSMGANKVVAQRTGGTDHVLMQAAGIPAFQFIQDPLDYGSRIHHTSIDSYDHLKVADLKQVSVILASMLWLSAERDKPLPRMPVQTKPQETDPFSYEEPEE